MRRTFATSSALAEAVAAKVAEQSGPTATNALVSPRSKLLNRSKSMNSSPATPSSLSNPLGPSTGSMRKIVPVPLHRTPSQLNGSSRKVLPLPGALARSNSNNSSSSLHKKKKSLRKIHPSGSRYSSRSFFDTRSRRGEIEELSIREAEQTSALPVPPSLSPSKLKASFHQTSANPSSVARSITFRVKLSRRKFRLAWFTIVASHATCVVYYVSSAIVYAALPHTNMARTLDMYTTTTSSCFPAMAVVYAMLAMAHLYLLIQMVWISMAARTLCFETRPRLSKTPPLIVQGSGTGRMLTTASPVRLWCSLSRLTLFRAWRSLCSPRGLLGIEGDHFDHVMRTREVLQIVLQTVHSSELARHLSFDGLVRLCTAFVIINCWIHVVLQRSDVPMQRLGALVFNMVLDLVSLIVIPVTVGGFYGHTYDPVLESFATAQWKDDAWFVHLVSDLRVILAQSWADLIWRLVIGIHLLSCFVIVKRLLLPPDPFWAITVHAAPNTTRSIAVAPMSRGKPSDIHPLLDRIAKRLPTGIVSVLFDRTKGCFQISSRLLLLAWGLGVLSIHIHAHAATRPPQCGHQVFPWFTSAPACPLVEWNCLSESKSPTLESTLVSVDPDVVLYLVVRNCRQLEVPKRIQTLSNLMGIKIQNTSIAMWDLDAALTDQDHQQLRFLGLIETNLTTIPAGFQSASFPKSIRRIAMHGTHLSSLPMDLAFKWSSLESLSLDASETLDKHFLFNILSKIPLVELSLRHNGFNSVPIELFQMPLLKRLNLDGNPMATLPASTDSTNPVAPALEVLSVESTSLSSLPAWLTSKTANSITTYARETPICQQPPTYEHMKCDVTAPELVIPMFQ